MPELPEVETTRRGIEPHLLGHTMTGAVVREPRLRWPVDNKLDSLVRGRPVQAVRRRGKYLLLDLDAINLIIHLGMSGSLRLVPGRSVPQTHDHVDLYLDSGGCVRYRDPRRFGCVLWTAEPVEQHPLLARLGPEPFWQDFDGSYLYRRSRGRRVAVKSFIMDAATVTGVGNIYASEALHLAGIHPARSAGRISQARFQRLARAIVTVLNQAIAAGGTTLRDFVDSSGQPGYFSRQLRVYGRHGLPCSRCGDTIRRQHHGQRATYYCPLCQT